MKLILKLTFYLFICFLDTSIWFIVNSFQGKKIISILKKRPWLKFSVNCSNTFFKRLTYLLTKLIKIRCQRQPSLSSCLSRSITASLLLDVLNIKNELYLGMIKSCKGNKIPHAWVKQTNTDSFITPGISEKDIGITLIKI